MVLIIYIKKIIRLMVIVILNIDMKEKIQKFITMFGLIMNYGE